MRRTRYLIGLFSIGTALLSADLFSGTWKLDPAKSSGPGLPKEAMFVVEDNGANSHVAVTATTADGTAASYTYDVPTQGGTGKVSGSPAFDEISIKRKGTHTMDGTYMKGGKTVRAIHSVVSKDGKSQTLTLKGADVQGKPISGTLKEVFEKQ